MRSAPTTPRGGPSASLASSPASSSTATTPGTTTAAASSSVANQYYTALLNPLQQRFIDIETRLKRWRITFRHLGSSKKISRRSASHDPNECETPRKRNNHNSNKTISLRNIDEDCSRTCPVPRKKLYMNLSGPPRPRPKLDPVSSSSDSLSSEEVCKRFKDIQEKSGQLNIGGQLFAVEFKDLERVEKDGQLGDGASGSVCKYRFKSRPIAVKQMRRTDSVDESKRIFMDLDVISRCRDCRYIVNYYGYIFTFDYVYICMELMCTCLEKLLNRRRADPSRHPDAVGLPEEIIGRIALSVVRALDYLKETHKIMHRDVKPSNILLDWFGNVKLCDFGISGKLIESKAITKTGCTGYLAPERVNIDGSACTYDVRADVWSLGITLIQLATGRFPYEPIHNTIELMLAIRNSDPPRLDPGPDGRFSAEFCQFIADCLQKDMTVRPKFRDLLDKPFLQRAAMAEHNGTVDVALWCASQQQGDSESEDAQIARAEYEAKYGRS